MESIRVFWDILLIRRGPRDAPASWTGLVLLGAVYLLSSLVYARAIHVEQTLTFALVDLALTVGIFSVILMIRGREYRLVQTLSALFGTSILLSVPNVALAEFANTLAAQDPVHTVLSILNLVLLLWAVVVIGHIVRTAIDVKFWTGVTVAMSYAIVEIVLLNPWLPTEVT